MKALKSNSGFTILQGPAVKLQKTLDQMAERYDVIVHAVNTTSNGDVVIVVERRKTEKQLVIEEISGT